MLKNYILLALRNFYKHKLFVAINVLGLGVSIACAIVAYLNYEFEADFNKQHQNLDMIYKINVFRHINDREQRYGITPFPLAPLCEGEMPGVEAIVRYSTAGVNLKCGDDADSKVFNQNIAFADKDFFRIFTFKVILGSTDQFFEKGKIVLTDETARKCFGNESPIGKNLTAFDDGGMPHQYSVIAVIEKMPLNSMVIFDGVASMGNFIADYKIDEFSWRFWVGSTFLLIPNSADAQRVEDYLAKYIPVQNKAREDWIISRFQVQSLRQFTKESRELWGNWLNQNLHPAQIHAPTIMAILMLLLACFNFMNTSISVANTRVKEIGVRKSVGGHRAHLIMQFIGENTLICLLALLASLLFASFLLDQYNSMWSYMVLKMSFTGDIGFWVFLLLMLIATSVAAGAYPAFYLSSFRPVEVLRGVFKFKGAGKFSQFLLGLQMTISLIALTSSIIFTQNAQYQEKFDMGYNQESIIVVPLAQGANYESLKSAYLANPDIIEVSATSNHIGWGSYPRTVEYIDRKTEVRVMDINTGYTQTMGLRLKAGRGFDPEFEATDPLHSAIVTELLVEELGITDDPINKKIKIDTLEFNIVGVVQNFYNSLWDKLNPVVMITKGKDTRGVLVVKTYSEKRKEVKEFMRKEWERLVPSSPFYGREQTEILQESKDVNRNIKNINLFLSLVAITLSLIALYTLVSLNIIKRTKEIGIRTVLGSKGINIVWLISKPFLIIIGLASILGGVIGYYLNSMLLKSLWVYHIDINILSVAIPVLIMYVVSFILIAVRVYLLLMRNPVESLRYE